MQWVPASVLTVVGVVVAVGFIGVGGPLSPLALLVGGVVILGLQRRKLRPVREVDWGGLASDGTVWAPLPVLAPGMETVRREPSPNRPLALAVARIESGQLVRSPWFAAGIALCLVMVGVIAWANGGGTGLPWRNIFVLFPIMAFPLTGMVVIAAHSAVTRARRDAAIELFDACPLSPATRTAGHLLTAWVPVVALGLFMAVFLLITRTRAHLTYGPIDSAAAGDVATALALGIGGVALGVALGRWAPWRLVPIVAVVALVQPIVAIGNIGEPHWSNSRQLSAWPRYPDHDLLFTIRPVWWHLVWLLALAAVVGCVAVARSGWRPVAVPLAAFVLLATLAGVAQTRPVSDGGAARLASMVAEPERYQSCLTAGRASVCAFTGYSRFAEEMLKAAAPVMAAVPPAAGPVVVRQVFNGDLANLGPEVARQLDGRGIGGGPASVIVFEVSDNARAAVRFTTALAAVGLPARAPENEVPFLVAGQARGVLAIWLAARGLSTHEAMELATAYDPSTDFGLSRQSQGMAWPDPCVAGPPPVAWAPEDLSAALSLLALPEAQVARVVQARWDDLTDPAATTDDLLVAVGLDPIGPPPFIAVGPEECTW